MSWVLTRTLPGGQEKTSTYSHGKKGFAARQATQSHKDNVNAGRVELIALMDALMTADSGETVGPFRGYSYRIDQK